jgi:cation diffusion facilitator CzcD-associated flavoprotein CzcO
MGSMYALPMVTWEEATLTRFKAPRSVHARYVAVCTGLHVIPSIPDVPGIEHVLNNRSSEGITPAVYHSVHYKSRSQLAGRRVMILGTGETGMDLAYEAVKAGAKEVTLCSRSGYNFSSPFHTGLTVIVWTDFCQSPKLL